ncbi:MAG TPA: pyrroloquinoline quinone biosynthesis protein PqqE [Inquilinus sp.]|nr:pyrroloquinoline quinone biosynthesis protein PqqE [Inquilinus sp.]
MTHIAPNNTPPRPEPPLAALLELTHRCPLQCPYCSNPLEMEQARDELSTAEWLRVMREAAALGILQIHFSGGEPTIRRDLAELVRGARDAGLYTNLITSGVAIDRDRFMGLVEAGLDHAQLSIQDTDPASAERIGHYPGAQPKKLAFAGWVAEAGLPLTLNAVVHRQNLDRLDAMIDLAVEIGAARLEVAHVQYYGWALKNRDALMPSREQLDRASAVVAAARDRLHGRLVIDYVVPDYYAQRPKACMGGWGRQFLNITPTGRVLPCHAAETIPGLGFESVRDRPLAEIWAASDAFQRFRGTAWMPEPCRGCPQAEIDWGGCRCQAMALTGRADATDPACALSPFHDAMLGLAESAAHRPAPPDFVYRRLRAAAAPAAAPRG